MLWHNLVLSLQRNFEIHISMASKSPLTIYKASAGSGKTFTLAAEYISLLVRAAARGQQEAFKHIVAVTFTVKATGEMKDRILGTLYNLSDIVRSNLKPEEISEETVSYLRKITQLTRDAFSSELTDDELLEISTDQLLALPTTALICKAAGSALMEILHNYDAFKVMTIDSFFQGVMKGVARELGLPANLRTEISDDEVRHLAVERLMDTLDKRLPLQSQVWNFVKDKLADGKSWNVGAILEDFAQQLGKEEYSSWSQKLQEKFEEDPDSLENFRKKLMESKNELQQNVKAEVDRVLQLMPDKIVDHPLFSTSSKSRLLALQNACAQMQDFEFETTLKTTLAKYLDTPESLLSKRTRANASEYDSLLLAAQEIAAVFSSAFENYKSMLKDFNTVSLVLANLHQLGLLTAIDKTVNEINAEKGQFLLSHTGPLLRDLMNGNNGGNTDFVFEKIGPTLNHIMIDEFQDTSNQQWQNFHPLVNELMSRTNGSNLIVGDVKQSIYRWRNGKWEILGNLENDFRGRVHAEPLVYNFRSDKIIIDFNNFIFPKLAKLLDKLAYDNFATGSESTDDFNVISTAYAVDDVRQHVPESKAADPPVGQVRVKIYDNQNQKNADIFHDICTQVSELHKRGVPYRDMVILVRASTIVPNLIAQFQNHEETKDVKLVFSNAYMLQSSIAVQMIVSALRYLSNPKDLVSKRFVAFHYQKDVLQSDIADDCLLHPKAEVPNEYLPDFLQNDSATLKKLPLYELNEYLMAKMKLGKLPSQAEYLMTFFDKLKAYSQDNPADIASFLDYWDSELCSVAIKPIDNDVLQIMTVHASKGLAFKHVFMPDCYYKLSGFVGNDIHWLPTENMPEPYNELPTLPVDFYSTRKLRDSAFVSFYQREVYQQFMDSINLLYVGFTRAKKSLYVWSYTNQSLSISSSMGKALKEVLQQNQDGLYYENDGNGDIYLFNSEHRSPEYLEVFADGKEPRSEERKATKEKESRMEPKFAEALPCKIRTSLFSPRYKQSTDAAKLSCREFNKVMYARIEEGNVFHDILSHISVAADWNRAVAQYEQEKVLSPEMKETFHSYFISGLENENVKDWFSGNYDVYNEQTVIHGSHGQVKIHRPDRVMLSKDGRRLIVVDYKFAKLESARDQKLGEETQLQKYEAQVSDYMELMKEMMPEKEVTGFLWFIKDNQVYQVK